MKKRTILMVTLSMLISATSKLPAVAQGNSAINDSSSSVYMTMYPVHSDKSGQEYYLNSKKQRVPLPGAGVNGPEVSIYTAPSGYQWYIDRTGMQQSLANSQNTGNDEYNYYNNSGGSGSSALGAAAGALLGSAAGAALGMASSGIPYGAPVYWGGGTPWYAGAGGSPVYVNRNISHVNEFQRQNNYWHNNSYRYNNWNNHKENWNNHEFNNGNWNNHWGQGNWPGKDHGFPPPADRVPGRLYAGGENRDGGEQRGAGEHRDGEHRGGEHRDGEHRDGGHRGGGHRDGEHRGGEHRDGGHRGGGHRR